MLTYPDFNKPFDIHTDASDFQLGAVISQEGKPIAFYSRKLNQAQRNYTTTERELLSIVETLKEYRNILLGYTINIYTDHQNLLFKNTDSGRVQRWRLLIEEYGPNFHYIKGELNIVADNLSRLPLIPTEKVEGREGSWPANTNNNIIPSKLDANLTSNLIYAITRSNPKKSLKGLGLSEAKPREKSIRKKSVRMKSRVKKSYKAPKVMESIPICYDTISKHQWADPHLKECATKPNYKTKK